MRLLPAIAMIAGSFAAAMPAAAATLSGTWEGNGYVNPSSGNRENVRCRVTYSPRNDRIVGVVARCASPSTTIRQTGELVKVRDDRYVGDFYNAEFNVGGRVSVSIRGSSQTVTFSSARGGGRLSLRRR